MKAVNIAKFKAELGKYLRYIRQGEEVVVFDRAQPLARVLPFRSTESILVIDEAADKNTKLSNLHFNPLLNKEINSLQFLLEERGDR